MLETGLAPSRLALEITASDLIDDFMRAVAAVRGPKALGVRIAMDDFGIGYSSLSNLQSFAFVKIKIDRSIISNLKTNPRTATIVRVVIELGRDLDVPIVAQGMETKEQRYCRLKIAARYRALGSANRCGLCEPPWRRAVL